MKTFRVILTAVVVLAGLCGPATVSPATQYACDAADISAAARAELAALTGAADGRLEVARHGSTLCVRCDGADEAKALADWAARHGLPMPTRQPGPALSAAEAVVADSGAHRTVAHETFVAILPPGGQIGRTARQTVRTDRPADPACQPTEQPAAPRGPPPTC